uniref:CHK kinase-like domain-containing protein n=2 Tax=Lygus hesperus TaxID=30085 RepID=A0A146KM02_LYGHE
MDTKWLAELLKMDYCDSEPVEIIGAEMEQGAFDGGHYQSSITRVKMRYLTPSKRLKTSSMIHKNLLNHMDIQGHEMVQFTTEVRMYNRALKNMEALMDEFNDKRRTLWPKFYGCRDNKEIVVEDLKNQNYEKLDRTKWVDLDHALLVLRSIGRFHAMSKILLERRVITEEDGYEKCWYGTNNLMKRKFFPGALHMLSQAMTNRSGFWPAGWENVAERIRAQIPTICEATEALVLDYNKDFEVLNHGDLWTPNIMFEHNMDCAGSPVGVKFIDYQTPHLNSFILDVMYFLHGSVRPSVRRGHKNQLLEAYHRSLSDNLNFFGYSEYVPTLDDVISEDKRFLPLAFSIVCSTMPLASSSSTKPFDLKKLFKCPPEEAFDGTSFTEEKIVKEICDDLTEFVRLGVI